MHIIMRMIIFNNALLIMPLIKHLIQFSIHIILKNFLIIFLKLYVLYKYNNNQKVIIDKQLILTIIN